MIKNILSVALVAAICTVANPVLAETKQAQWVGDVPIMPSLTIEPGLGFAFDNPDGRIVTIYLSGDAKLADITKYYNQALEPLGWNRENGNRWLREQEVLEIRATEALSTQLWKITLRPR